MNGQLILFLLTLLLQGPSEPMVMPPPIGGPARGMAVDPSTQCKRGFGIDPNGKYCMIVQIPPAAIAAFSKGDAGSELMIDIPSESRNYVERILFRVGTGEVENSPPPNRLLSDNRMSSGPVISNLDRTVSIDRGSDVRNASAQNGGGQGVFPNNSNEPAVLPNTNPNSLYDKTRNAPGLAGNAGYGVGSPNPASSTSYGRTDTDQFGAANNSQYRSDDFGAKSPFSNLLRSTPTNPNSPYQPNTNPSTYGQTSLGQSNLGQSNLGQSNLGQSNYGQSGYGQNSAGQVTPSQTANGQGQNYGATGYGTSANIPGTNLASNAPNTPLYGNQQQYASAQPYGPATQPNPYNNQPPLLAQATNYGTPTQQQNSYGSTFPTTANSSLQSNNTFAGVPNNTAGLSNTAHPANTHNNLEETNAPRDSLLPFLLLFSIVINVYVGLWMNYSRKRYRELRSQTRGIPASELMS